MRWLFWFAVGFSAACAGFSYALPYLWLVPVCAMLAVAGIAIRKDTRILWGFATAILGILAAWGYCSLFSWLTLSPIRQLDGKVIGSTVTVSGDCWETAYGCALDGQITVRGRVYDARVYAYEPLDLQPGDTVEGQYRLTVADADSYLPGKGVFVILSLREKDGIHAQAVSRLRYLGAEMCIAADDMLESLFPEDALSIAKGIFLGDTTQMDYMTDTALRVCGLRHTVAVSGMHLAILFAILFALAGKRPLPALILAGPVLLCYAAMVGLTVSVVRAYIMLLIFLLSMVVRRQYDVLTSLAAAVVIMQLRNPFVITAIGFQLSVCGVLGIALFSQPLYKLLRKRFPQKNRLLANFLRALSVAAGAMVLTTPLCAWHFGCVSLIGVLVAPILGGVITVIFSGVLFSTILGFAWLPGGKIAAWAVTWLIRLLNLAVLRLASLPLAAVYTRSGWIVAWLVFVYILIALTVLCRGRHIGRYLCLAVISLCLAVGISWMMPRFDHYRVTVLNVGQGESVILQSGNTVYLVDCGGDHDEDAADIAAETLLSRGISHIDGVIVSHYDSDHCGGVPYFLQRIRTDALYLPCYGDAEGFCDSLVDYEGEILFAESDMTVESGNTKIGLFVPISPANDNESSLSVLFQTQKCDILITGDLTVRGEEKLLSRQELPLLTALIVGHHGAKSSTGEALLEATAPQIAIISVGKNSHGHPSEEVIERLLSFGCDIYITERDGTVNLRG